MSDNNPDLAAQEVDEELRRDQLNALWKKFGKYIIGTAIGVALTVAGRELYTAQVQSGQEENARIFAEALDTSKDGDAVAIWQQALTNLSDGYTGLASLQLAEAQLKAGDAKAALATYETIGASAGLDPVIGDLAHLQAAILLTKEKSFDEARSRLSLIAVKGKPWYFSAQEQLGYLEMSAGNTDEALSRFTLLAADIDTPANIKARAKKFETILGRMDANTEPAAVESEGIANEK